MSLFAIIGSGFGLYGYLPALIDGCAHRIVLPERYRSRFLKRPELARFDSAIQWKADEDTVLGCADSVALALPPINQREWLTRCLKRPGIKSLLLEKPLAHSPEVAAEIFKDLIHSQKKFRIGYTFRYTTWGKQILSSLSPTKNGSSSLSIYWSFLAHHYLHGLHNWKRFNTTGGGAIRFYGIQIIALLAEIGYRDAKYSRSFGVNSKEIEKWDAVFCGPGLPECEVMIDTKSPVRKFHVGHKIYPGDELSTTLFANLSDPFDSENETYQLNQIDRRVPMLSQLCNSLCEDSTNLYEFYGATIELWQTTEEKTVFEIMNENS